MKLRLISWNVNGIRAISKKGFPEWLHSESPNILCLQETRAHPEQLPDSLIKPEAMSVRHILGAVSP